MAELCANPEHRDRHGAPHEIPDGHRRIRVPQLTIEWGDQDIRDTWTGGYVWCSFACMEEHAGEWGAQHDGGLLVHGEPPEGDEPE